jgi:hypothetical protein
MKIESLPNETLGINRCNVQFTDEHQDGSQSITPSGDSVMVTLMFLFAPVVVLIAVLIMNAFEKRRNSLSALHMRSKARKHKSG